MCKLVFIRPVFPCCPPGIRPAPGLCIAAVMQLAERVFPVSEYLKRQFTAAFFYPFEFCLTGALKNLSFLRAVQRNFYQWTPEFGYPNGKRAVLPDLHRHMQGQIPSVKGQPLGTDISEGQLPYRLCQNRGTAPDLYSEFQNTSVISAFSSASRTSVISISEFM